MESFFTDSQRCLQAEFGTTALADRIHEAAVAREISDQQADFIHARNCFFLSTVDEFGFPSCSYKGGAQGFARVIDPRTLVFPNYDGNGMYMSLGNIEHQAKVGLLFVDFETPNRLRMRGHAKCVREGPLLASYPGANLVVTVSIDHVWVNCPRYVHQMQPLSPSPYLPHPNGKIPLALWKRIDLMQDVLTEGEKAEAAELGLLSIETYEAMVSVGKLA